ncbi:MAG: bifunctional diaminohydroxyphosphoribosylaminopyrimidine deaminase/5-amino-6-(5-phosphoribosylamino)uracil reductase RibD [Candidatus Margulisbacteria bacterium]|nr:bifunctional diaminohydroxyphosphoribosylaminopyrimidine deaminase/5-amino-6-(5-phosphoribosylamino)uracil reductase RibD [Candidatus Margulisiibacteriota bacterium]
MLSPAQSLDSKFMKKALSLAIKGAGSVSPNPMVGAIVVKDNKIIASGFHQKYGEAHAEKIALNRAGAEANGATLYVTLEPCCHFGKTPPCTDAIIEAGISKVVVAMKDPNPLVSESENILKTNGVAIEFGMLEKEAKVQNQQFIKNIKYNRPYVTLKLGTTLDGKIADRFYNSKWITNEKSREYVHQLRYEHDAILVGAGTVCSDNPTLTVRHTKKKLNWTKIIVDPFLQVPPNAKIFESGNRIVFVTQYPALVNEKEEFKKKLQAISDQGSDFIFLELKESGFDIKRLLKEIYALNIFSIFVEGGSQIASSFLQSNSVDRFIRFIAPRLLNDDKAIPMFKLDKTLIEFPLEPVLVNTKTFDQDVMLEYLLHKY